MVSVDSGILIIIIILYYINVVPITAVANAAERRLMRKICNVFAIDLTEHRAIMVRMYTTLTAVVMTAMITEYARKMSPSSCKLGLPGPS